MPNIDNPKENIIDVKILRVRHSKKKRNVEKMTVKKNCNV